VLFGWDLCTYRGEGLWLENLSVRDHFKDVGVGGSIIKMDLEEVKCEAVGWIHLAQNMVRWQAR